VPVKKACGKKKPDTQKTLGAPFAIQPPMKARRSMRSVTHDASGLSDGYDLASHISGTLFVAIAVPTASSSLDMTVRPLSARPTSFSDDLTAAVSLL
jgi:hypothetical protein